MNAQTFDFPVQARPPVDFRNGLIVDNFAGGGGASTGIEWALGRPVDRALNHDPAAIAVHKANHPQTKHFCQSIYSADPLEITDGQPVLLGWFSPDCKHFSKAKGGKPVEKHIRGLAWVVVHWVRRIGAKNIKMFMLENVEEFLDWGDLIETDKGWMPDPAKKGNEFKLWVKALKKGGATAIEWRVLKACDYGAPTIRKRLFVLIRFDGEPIAWPEPTHGDPKSEAVLSGKLKPWRTAAEIIDWSLPCPSIFDRKKPLKEATLRRIAAGIVRYVINAKSPFIVPLTHHGSAERVYSVDDPLVTVTGAHRGELAVVEPFVVPVTHTKNGGTGRSAADPLATITTAKGGEHALVSPHIMTMRNAQKPYQGADEPTHTITAGGAHQCLVAATLVGRGGRAGQSRPRGLDEPLATCTAKADVCVAEARLEKAEQVAAFMAQHNTGVIGREVDAPLSTVTMTGSHQQLVTASFVRTAHGERDKSGKKRGRGDHSLTEPFPTVTSAQDSAFVTSHLVKLRGTCADGQAVDEPMPTVTAGGFHIGEVRAFLIKYYGIGPDGHSLDEPLGTVTTKDRFAAVTVTIAGEEYVIADIGMRMLTVDELKLAQGFPADYDMTPTCWYTTDGGQRKYGPLPKSHGVAKVGNSVSPYMPDALIRANLPDYVPILEAAE